VIDEPFYAAFLAETGIDHPLREEVLAGPVRRSASRGGGPVGPVPGGRPIFYQKHMAHHMTGGDDLSWMAHCRSAFLIRSPPEVLASYAAKRRPTGLEDIGFVRQAELFDREAQRLGTPPPVIEARDVLTDPRRALTALCAALDVPFAETMLGWPPGPASPTAHGRRPGMTPSSAQRASRGRDRRSLWMRLKSPSEPWQRPPRPTTSAWPGTSWRLAASARRERRLNGRCRGGSGTKAHDDHYST